MKSAYEIACERVELLNPIPAITEPMGRYWNQPDRSRILIDDTHAVMDQRTFDQLKEYSASNPSGAYEGKMWKRHDGSFDRAFLGRGGKPVWMLCWYGRHPNPDKVSNNYRVILIADSANGEPSQSVNEAQ